MDSVLKREKLGTSRDSYWDFLKGVAIFLVLLGHSIQYGGGSQWYASGLYFDCFLFQLIYSFHMPLFIFISGFFFQKSVIKYKPDELLKKKFYSLLIPITSFATLYLLFRVFVQQYQFSLPLALNTFFTTLWYLWTYLYCCIVTIVINSFAKDKLYIYVIICCLSLFLPNSYNCDAFTFLYPFFLLGYFTQKNGYMAFVKSLRLSVLIVIVSLFVLLLSFWNKDSYYYNSGTSILTSIMDSNRGGAFYLIGLNFFRWLCGLLGLIIVLFLSLKFSALVQRRDFLKSVQKFFVHIGLLSMGLYCFQDFLYIVYYLSFHSISSPSLLSMFFAFVVVVSISLLCTKIAKRIRVLNFLILGGR